MVKLYQQQHGLLSSDRLHVTLTSFNSAGCHWSLTNRLVAACHMLMFKFSRSKPHSISNFQEMAAEQT